MALEQDWTFSKGSGSAVPESWLWPRELALVTCLCEQAPSLLILGHPSQQQEIYPSVILPWGVSALQPSPSTSYEAEFIHSYFNTELRKY